MNLTRFSGLTAVIGLLITSATPSYAANCEPDRTKFCAGITPGNGAVHACMLDHVGELTPKCAKTVTKAENLGRSFETLCAASIQQFCAQYTSSGRNRMVECIASDKNRLTRDCRQGVEDFQALNYRLRD